MKTAEDDVTYQLAYGTNEKGACSSTRPSSLYNETWLELFY